MPLRPHNSGLVLRLTGSWRKQPRFPVGICPAVIDGSDCLLGSQQQQRSFSDKKNKTTNFQPQRRPNRNYRPIVPRVVKKKGPLPDTAFKNPAKEIVNLDSLKDDDFDSISQYGNKASGALEYLEQLRNERNGELSSVEAQLRLADYFTAFPGSLEDLVGERKLLANAIKNPLERERFLKYAEKWVDQERINEMDLLNLDYDDSFVGDDDDDDEDEHGNMSDSKLKRLAEAEEGDLEQGIHSHDDEESFDEDEEEEDDTILAKGLWGTELISYDYVQKPQRGGRKGSYRALAIGGNGNGCGGFATAKADTIDRAIEMAARKTRKNIFFVERFQGCSLTRNLAGRHNSCIVKLRATTNGLRGNDLISTILMHFGVTHCSSKTFGNRGDYNVVYATFKALMTHESAEEIALKRGKRLITIERARRLQV